MHKHLSLALAGVLLVLAACRRNTEITYRLLLPDQYMGWVRIDFEVKTPPAIDSNNVITFRVGEDGTCQNTSLMVAPVKYEFFYDTPAGLKPVRDDFVDRRTDAGGVTVRSDNPQYGTSWYFFVGPKEYRDRHPQREFTSHASPLPTPGRLVRRDP